MVHSRHLMKQIRSGNDSAFTDLINPNIEKSYRIAYYILRSEADAEEVVQTAMLEAYTKILSGEKINNFQAWFNKLISRRSIDLLRKIIRQKSQESGGIITNISDSARTIDLIINNETKCEVFEALNSLENIDYRNVIVMYYYQELKISEIADILDVSPSTVKTHLRRGKAALGKILTKNKIIGVN